MSVISVRLALREQVLLPLPFFMRLLGLFDEVYSTIPIAQFETLLAVVVPGVIVLVWADVTDDAYISA